MTLRPVFRLALASLLVATLGLSESVAQSDSQTHIQQNSLSQYAVIKSLIDPAQTGKYPAGRDPENLATCGDMELALGLGIEIFERRGRSSTLVDASGHTRTVTLARIAGHYYKWVHELPSLGYPREIVLPLVREAEKRLLFHVALRGDDNFHDTLAAEATLLVKQLDAAKSKWRLRAKTVYWNDECGGGGITVEFKIPKGTRLFLASDFYVLLCKKQGYEPLDRRQCNHWVQVRDGSQTTLAGTYNYIVQWPDGQTEIARFNAENEKPNREGNVVFRLER